jgi:hypothetical protein
MRQAKRPASPKPPIAKGPKPAPSAPPAEDITTLILLGQAGAGG